MVNLQTLPEAVAAYAALGPQRPAAADSRRSLTYGQLNERASRLANALLALGLRKGDRVAVLAYNCVEWVEVYIGLGRAGLVTVPINFRLVAPEIRYIVENCEASAFIVQDELLDRVEAIRADLPIDAGRYVHFGVSETPAGYQAYETLIQRGRANDPQAAVVPTDSFAFLYTSGTTGRPKGAIRSHGSHSAVGFVTSYDMGFARDDTGLLVMPMCHANSLFFLSAFLVIGGSVFVYDRKSFDPEHLLRTLAERGAAFTSLVPTHYIMMLSVSAALRSQLDVSKVRKLMISSAPARRETKLEIMDYFRNSQLFELYGSTEGGWVTLLRPDEQLTHLGSVGREWTGNGRTRLLGPDGEEVPEGEAGELFALTPHVFDGYWKLPEKTAEAFRGGYCSVGDLARRDEQGFYYLVDRKSNMIISGGENVYPSEVEALLGQHPKVRDVAVIGLPHDKWGEAVHAVVILHEGQAMQEDELLEWCKPRIAGYKRPRSAAFIREEDMPRTATGKIQHRLLREKLLRR